MTEKANPSINRPAEAFKTAGAIAYGGHGGDGFVVDGANPTDISTQDGGITEANLNTFAETSSASSFDVTIDGGEAFVFGSWLAIDTDTTVSLAASTDNQTVYVGWNKNGADDVIIGLAGAFSSASGDTDERIPLFEYDTDGTGVTSVTDLRRIGPNSIETQFKKAAVPFSEISDGDNASVRVNVPAGSTLDVWQVGVQDGSQAAPSGLSVEVRDLTNAVTIYSANQKTDTGYPLASKDGDIDVSFRVVNSTGSTINASGYVVYTSD